MTSFVSQKVNFGTYIWSTIASDKVQPSVYLCTLIWDLRPKSEAQRRPQTKHLTVRSAVSDLCFAAARSSSCLVLFSLSYSSVPLNTACLHSDLSAVISSQSSVPMSHFLRDCFRVSLYRSFGLPLPRCPSANSL